MIKLLFLCLLATLVTMKEQEHSTPKPSEHPTSRPSTTEHHESSPKAHTETSKVAVAHTDHPTPDHTAPLTVLQTCSCNGGVGCQDNRCTVKESKRFCVSMAETNTFDGTQNSVNNSCGDDINLCNVSITITLKEGVYWRSRTECCTNGNDCNSHSVSVPPEDTAHGKLECPSCFGANETHCKPHSVKCAASETKCINVTGTVTKGDITTTFVGRGCASLSAARIRNGTTLTFGDATYHFTKTILTDDTNQTSGNVPFIFILSSFVVLLQAKFIY